MDETQRGPSEARFRDVVDGAPDGVVVSRDGRILYANAAALRLLGFGEVAELIGQPMSIFLDADAMMTMRRRLQQMRETGAQPTPREYLAKRRDGSTVTAEISSIFIEYDGAPAVLAFARDVTERSRLRAQLEHADRLASLGMLAGGVAHEINNPLAFVGLATSLLEQRLAGNGDPAELTALVGDIRAGIDRIAAVARDLRLYGRYEDEPASIVDVAAVLDDAERLVAHELRSRARLRRELETLSPVLAVPRRLEQVFVNLLLNAAHAIPDEREGEVVVRARSEGAWVIVEIEDDGVGIPEGDLARIFEPFHTTRASSSGTGLGLSICRGIVERAGGTIHATGAPGQGTVIQVRLPRALAVSAAAEAGVPRTPLQEPAPTHVVGATSPRRRVFIVDDEPAIVAVLVRTLGERHDIIGETDPAAALARLLDGAAFDVVLCDLMMPGTTGMELHATIARERPGFESRFVFMTGGSHNRRARDFLDSVPNGRLMKPFAPDQLEALLLAPPGG